MRVSIKRHHFLQQVLLDLIHRTAAGCPVSVDDRLLTKWCCESIVPSYDVVANRR